MPESPKRIGRNDRPTVTSEMEERKVRRMTKSAMKSRVCEYGMAMSQWIEWMGSVRRRLTLGDNRSKSPTLHTRVTKNEKQTTRSEYTMTT